jgi:hypothetical protein
MKMNFNALETRDQLAAAYLKHLQMLASEIAVAISSIASNSLSRFQDSVAKQETLCSTLAILSDSYKRGFRPPGQAVSSYVDGPVEAEIRGATRLVRDLTSQYSVLLNQSSKTASLLISLCRSHTGQFQEAHGARRKHQTWSCEM